MGVFGWFALIERALQAPSVDAVLPTIHFQVHTAFGHSLALVVGNAVAVFQELWFLEGLDFNSFGNVKRLSTNLAPLNAEP